MTFMLCGDVALHVSDFDAPLRIAGPIVNHAPAFVGSWVQKFPAVAVRGDAKYLSPFSVDDVHARKLLAQCIFDCHGCLTHVSPQLLKFLERAYVISGCASGNDTKFSSKPIRKATVCTLTNPGRVRRFCATPSNNWECTAAGHSRQFSSDIDSEASEFFGSPVCIVCSKKLLESAPVGWHALRSAEHLIDPGFYKEIIAPITSVLLRPILIASMLRSVSPRTFSSEQLREFNDIVSVHPGLVSLQGLTLSNLPKVCAKKRAWFDVAPPKTYRFLTSLFVAVRKSMRSNQGVIGHVPFLVRSMSYHGATSFDPGQWRTRSIKHVLRVVNTGDESLPKEPLAIIGGNTLVLSALLKIWNLIDTKKCLVNVVLTAPSDGLTKTCGLGTRTSVPKRRFSEGSRPCANSSDGNDTTSPLRGEPIGKCMPSRCLSAPPVSNESVESGVQRTSQRDVRGTDNRSTHSDFHDIPRVAVIKGAEHVTWPLLYEIASKHDCVWLHGSYFSALRGLECGAGLCTGGAFARLAEAARAGRRGIIKINLDAGHITTDPSPVLASLLEVERLWWGSVQIPSDGQCTDALTSNDTRMDYSARLREYTNQLIAKPDSPGMRVFSRRLSIDPQSGPVRVPMSGPLSRQGKKRARVSDALTDGGRTAKVRFVGHRVEPTIDENSEPT